MEGVDLAFHAAALKQVPSCEFFPMQAVLTNIVGSHNVVESAIAHRVKSLVCLSTDKAVFPVNAMGMSKGMMEKVATAAARRLGESDTMISSVRYGNVMYSRGSVIPLFIDQIKHGQPLTVTDPEMTRFLLSLRSAIDLVLFAFENAGQGDIFVRKAPACTVADLAQALKNLFKSDVPVQIIGTRHAEKLFETLATAGEIAKAEDMGDYLRVRMDDRDLNYAKYFTEGSPEEATLEDYTSHNTQRLSVPEVEELLLALPDVQRELAAWQAQMRVGVTGADGLAGHPCPRLFSWPGRCGGPRSRSPDLRIGRTGRLCGRLRRRAPPGGHEPGRGRVVAQTNLELTRQLIAALEERGSRAHVLFSSSTHIERDTAYGTSKREAAALLSDWAAAQRGQIHQCHPARRVWRGRQALLQLGGVHLLSPTGQRRDAHAPQ